jgi:3-hydroxyisobutyrate dehydrogenase-like beta-hydroxyacid dehydrogenase
MEQKPIGLIGLGKMGYAVGKNLLKKGNGLVVYDLDPDAVGRTVKHGAVAAASAGAVARRVDTVITILPNGPDVERAVLGPGGVLEGAHPGTLVLESSTISPEVTKRVGDAVRAAGHRMVDAAIGRLPKEAEEANLVFMVGAVPEDLASVRPLLMQMGTEIFHCGGPGAGVTMKLVNNLLAHAIMSADLEALTIGAKAGLDADLMIRVLSSTAADNRLLRTQVEKYALSGEIASGFKAVLAHKDVGLALSMAAQLGVPLWSLPPVQQVLNLTLARGRGDLASIGIATVIEEAAGVRIGKPQA